MMRRFLLFISVILLSVGCVVEEYEVPFVNSISSTSVVLSSEMNSTAKLTFCVADSWRVESEDEGVLFDVSTKSGAGAVSSTITITALLENDTRLTNILGTLDIVNSASGDVIYSVEMTQTRQPAAQVTLMYFMGTSLGSCYSTNVADAKSAISAGALGEYGRYFYCLPSSYSTTILYEISQDEVGEVVTRQIATYNFNAYKSGSLSTVVEAVKSACGFVDGGDNTMNLVLSSHGTAWISTGASSYSSLMRSDNFVLDRLSEWESVAGAPVQTRYMGGSTDGYMNIADLVTEMESIDEKFGFIIFDSCLMSSVEVLYRLRDFSDYVIASVTEIISFGFPYETVVPNMFTDGGTNFNVQGICEAYYKYYNEDSHYKFGTIAACVTSELEALAVAQKSLSLSVLSDVSDLQTYDGYSSHVLYDLGDYVNSAVSSTADIDSYTTQFDKAFPPACRLHTEKYIATLGSYVEARITYYSGVSTSAPTKSSTYYSEWLNEPWATATTISGN